MKKTIKLYLLLYEDDIEYLSNNNFRELPVIEISGTSNMEEIENLAVSMMNGTYEPLITAEVICDFEKYKEYKDSHHTEEYINENGDFTKIAVETINYSVTDKIKVINIFGRKLPTINRNLYDILDNEQHFFKLRLTGFLHSNSHEVIPYDYFGTTITEKNEPQDFTDEEIQKQVKKAIEEQNITLKKAKDRIAGINYVEEAVDFLINEDLDEEEIKSFKNKSFAAKLEYFGEDSGLHFGYGIYLRNLFFHGNKNQRFFDDLEKYRSNRFIHQGELGEGIIYDLLWRKLNGCETSHENIEKIEEIKRQSEHNPEDHSNVRMKLLSYNFTEDETERYLELEELMDHDHDNFEEHYFQQKAFLTKLNEEERETFQNLKQDYFNIKNVIDKLKHNHE